MKMIHTRPVVLLIALVCIALLPACDSEPLSKRSLQAPVVQVRAYEANREAAEPVGIDRQLIRTGALEIEVEKVDIAVNEIVSIADSHGGFAEATSVEQVADDRRSGQVTLKIPAEHFDTVVAQIIQLGDVTRQTAATQDVTRQHVNLNIRLDASRQAKSRLEQLLKQEPAGLADILAVERELTRVITEIEQLEGERRFLDAQIALARITISLYEPGGQAPRARFGPIREAFNRSLETLVTSVAALVYVTFFVAPWLLLTAAGWWAVMALRKRSR